MKKWIVGFLLGAVVGMLGIIPVIQRGLPLQHSVRPLTHWIAMGIIIVVTQVNLSPWLKGLIFSVLMTLPISVVLFPSDVAYLILGGAVVFGPLIAVLGDKFTRGK